MSRVAAFGFGSSRSLEQQRPACKTLSSEGRVFLFLGVSNLGLPMARHKELNSEVGPCGNAIFGCGSKPMVPSWGRCTTHVRTHFSGWIESDVHWGLTDLDFDPWPSRLLL